jgi:hypothetical protein
MSNIVVQSILQILNNVIKIFFSISIKDQCFHFLSNIYFNDKQMCVEALLILFCM